MMYAKKILHVGWGFIPWRSGGLIEYTQDLMHFQIQLGWDVHYFFSGRKYPFKKVTALKEWSFNQVRCYEVVNSSIIHGGDAGTQQPEMQLNEPISENFFRYTLEKVKPEIIHFHEFAGIPSSFIEIAKNEFCIPTIMTLADYYLLCPTIKLFNYSRKNCRLKKVSSECVQCCSNAPQDHRKQIVQTLLYPCKNWWIFRHAPRPVIGRALKYLYAVCQIKNKTEISYQQRGAFEKRRKINLERLHLIDQLVARSKRVENIYREYLGEHARIVTINPHLIHIDRIHCQAVPIDVYPIHFITLNGLVSIQKGGRLILDSVNILNREGLSNRFVLHVYGALGDEFQKQVYDTKNIVYHGEYVTSDLNKILSGKHVGLLPSVWEEVYGYVGPEMLAKGLPLIANKIGGITEYAIDGVNSILNISCSLDEFVKHLKRVIFCPELIFKLNHNILSECYKRNYDHHFRELDSIYSKLISCNRKN